jgi:hypothetical protein
VTKSRDYLKGPEGVGGMSKLNVRVDAGICRFNHSRD